MVKNVNTVLNTIRTEYLENIVLLNLHVIKGFRFYSNLKCVRKFCVSALVKWFPDYSF